MKRYIFELKESFDAAEIVVMVYAKNENEAYEKLKANNKYKNIFPEWIGTIDDVIR